jgi:hypothetical protein
MTNAPPPTPATLAPLEKSACFLFESMIKEHGQKYVVDMGREDTPAGHLVRRFLRQERRMTFVYSHGTWYSGLDVVPGPSPLIVMCPTLGPRDVPKRPNTKVIDRLACDKYRPRGVTNANGVRKATQEHVIDDTGPIIPYVPRKPTTPPPSPPPTKRVKVERVKYMGVMLPKDLVDTLKAQFSQIAAQAATP